MEVVAALFREGDNAAVGRRHQLIIWLADSDQSDYRCRQTTRWEGHHPLIRSGPQRYVVCSSTVYLCCDVVYCSPCRHWVRWPVRTASLIIMRFVCADDFLQRDEYYDHLEQVVKVIWRKSASHPSWQRIHSFRAGDNATTLQAADELICRLEGWQVGRHVLSPQNCSFPWGIWTPV